MKPISKIFTVLSSTFLLTSGLVNAQTRTSSPPIIAQLPVQTYFTDVEREVENFYIDTQGSRFIISDWSKAKITTNAGNTYTDLLARYDLWNDKVEVSKDNRKFIINRPKEITLYHDSLGVLNFRSGFPAIKEYNNKTLYQVLVDGKTSLLKKSDKKLQVESVYNSGLKSSQFNNVIKYFIYKDHQITELPLKSNQIIAALDDKKSEVLNYVKDNKLNLKNEKDVESLITYYNSL